MGAWGFGLLENDYAADIVDRYRDLINSGFTKEVAIERLCEDFIKADDEKTFWLVLAEIQLQDSELDRRVKEQALKVLEERSYPNMRVMKDWSELDTREGVNEILINPEAHSEYVKEFGVTPEKAREFEYEELKTRLLKYAM